MVRKFIERKITVKGKPSVIPGVAAWYKKTDLPPSLKAHYANDPNVDTGGAGWPGPTGGANPGDGLPYSILKEGFGYNDGSFKEVLAWIDAVSDKATIAPTVWSTIVERLRYN